MGVLDMFDKLDDIIYKPVETLCDWVEEPLRKWGHEREMADAAQTAKREENMRRLDVQLEVEREEQAAKLRAQEARWNMEIQKVIDEQEAARRDQLVEAIKNYQIQLTGATKDIVESIGKMSIELRRRANELVIEKTAAYKAIQDEAKRQSMEELKEASEAFAESAPDTYHILVGQIMQERKTMVGTAGRCIHELSEDLKRLNENADMLMQQGMDATRGYLQPLVSRIGERAEERKQIEKKEQIEKDVIESSYVEV